MLSLTETTVGGFKLHTLSKGRGIKEPVIKQRSKRQGKLSSRKHMNEKGKEKKMNQGLRSR